MHWKREQKAMNIHYAEIERVGAECWNFGWGTNVEGNWISIASKTSEGILTTNVDFDAGGTVEHVWRKRS